MGRLFIPDIGSTIILSEDWTFTLHSEYRNETLAKKLGFKLSGGAWVSETPMVSKNPWETMFGKECGLEVLQVTIPKGTEMTVRRMYVKQNQAAYASITFSIKKGPYKGSKFWVKLKDANNIHFEEDTVKHTVSLKHTGSSRIRYKKNQPTTEWNEAGELTSERTMSAIVGGEKIGDVFRIDGFGTICELQDKWVADAVAKRLEWQKHPNNVWRNGGWKKILRKQRTAEEIEKEIRKDYRNVADFKLTLVEIKTGKVIHECRSVSGCKKKAKEYLQENIKEYGY